MSALDEISSYDINEEDDRVIVLLLLLQELVFRKKLLASPGLANVIKTESESNNTVLCNIKIGLFNFA